MIYVFNQDGNHPEKLLVHGGKEIQVQGLDDSPVAKNPSIRAAATIQQWQLMRPNLAPIGQSWSQTWPTNRHWWEILHNMENGTTIWQVDLLCWWTFGIGLCSVSSFLRGNFFAFPFLHHLCTIPNIGTLMRFSGIASQLVFGGGGWLPFCGMYFHSDGKPFQKDCLHPDVWYLVADSPLVEWWQIFPGGRRTACTAGVWSGVCLCLARAEVEKSRRDRIDTFFNKVPCCPHFNLRYPCRTFWFEWRGKGILEGREVTLAEDGDAVLLIEMWQWCECWSDTSGFAEERRKCIWHFWESGRKVNQLSECKCNTNKSTNTNTKYKYKHNNKIHLHLAVLGKQEKGQSTLWVQFCNALCAVN